MPGRTHRTRLPIRGVSDIDSPPGEDEVSLFYDTDDNTLKLEFHDGSQVAVGGPGGEAFALADLFKSGAADPRAGAGVASGIGSLYLRTSGEAYQKTGAGATAWTPLLQAP